MTGIRPPLDYARAIVAQILWDQCRIWSPGGRTETDTGWVDNPPTSQDCPCLFMERGNRYTAGIAPIEGGRYVLYLPFDTPATTDAKVEYPVGSADRYDIVYAPPPDMQAYRKLGLDKSRPQS